MTNDEKELAEWCAEYANGDHDEFPVCIQFLTLNFISDPTIENLSVCMKSYATFVLCAAIKTGQKQAQEELLSQLFRGVN